MCGQVVIERGIKDDFARDFVGKEDMMIPYVLRAVDLTDMNLQARVRVGHG